MRHIKSYKLFESAKGLHDNLILYYGVDVIRETDSIIDNLKDILLELNDIGIETVVGYSPLTLTCNHESPKLLIHINMDEKKFDKIKDTIQEVTSRIDDYATSVGFKSESGQLRDPQGFVLNGLVSIQSIIYKL